jgi:membrane protein
MLGPFNLPITLRELLRRTYAEVQRDDVMGLAAQLSFYLVLSVFPALVCLIALASLFPIQNLTDETTRLLGPFVPTSAVELLREFMVRIGESRDTGLLSLGLLVALWSASTPMVAVANVMNRAYGITEARPWWKVRLTAILLSAGLAVFILVAFMLVVFGPQLADLLASWIGLPSVFVWTWKILQWPLVLALVAIGIGFVYYFAPDADQDWVWITPGSIVATVLWTAGSLGFRWYAVNFGSYDVTYGALGGMMLLLMWFYVSGVAIVIGAELNAEIEHASPWGKDYGERTPGERMKIGPRAERGWRERQAGRTARTSPA